MMEKIVVCNIGSIWDRIDRMKVYMEDNNVLPMAFQIEVYI